MRFILNNIYFEHFAMEYCDLFAVEKNKISLNKDKCFENIYNRITDYLSVEKLYALNFAIYEYAKLNLNNCDNNEVSVEK